MRARSTLVAVALLLAACGGGGGGDDARGLAPLPGLDPYLDRLLAQCEAEDEESCARLILEDGAAVYADRALTALRGESSAGESGAAGSDEAERLAACEAGDVEVCAELYLDAPVGSELEERALAGMLGNVGPDASAGGGSAISVDPDGEAFYGDVALEGGFTPDPYVVELTAGGSADASTLATGCAGGIGPRPDVRLVFEAGALPLNIYATAAAEDLTLVVRDPSGRYRCNDDFDGLDPAVLIDRPASGTYEIWVGVWGGAGTFADATLSISELDPVFS